jgi:hypothetical protein
MQNVCRRFAGLKIAMSNFKSTKTERSESLFGEVIFSYTRAQAIADRVLIDVTPTALEAGFRFPVAMTAALMAAVETIPQQYSHEDIEGRLWGRALDGVPGRSQSETWMLTDCL